MLLKVILSALAFILAIIATWVVISIVLATFLWITDTHPRDSWWSHFKAILIEFEDYD